MNREEILSAVAPCGIACSLCPMHEKLVTPELQKRVGAMLGLPPEKITCKGCRSDQRAPLCPADCPTLTCSREKGVEFCHECADFPCKMLNPASDGAERLPHNLKVYNLCRMKLMGVEKWLEEDAGPTLARYYRGKMVIGKGPEVKE
jgi:hypothetical protein